MDRNVNVDVCIPVYNGARTLKRALDSVFRQSFRDFRVFVIDDCSSDSTSEIVRQFQNENVYYIRNERNLGMVENWNKCLGTGTSPLIQILHQDDYIEPEFLKIMVTVMGENCDLALVASEARPRYSSKGLLWNLRPYLRWKVSSTYRRIARQSDEAGVVRYSSSTHDIKRFISDGHFLECSSVVFRRSKILECGGFSNTYKYSTDEEYWTRILTKYPIAKVGRRLINRCIDGRNYEFETWSREDFAREFLMIRLKLWEYASFDEEIALVLENRWTEVMKTSVLPHIKRRVTASQFKQVTDLVKLVENVGLMGLRSDTSWLGTLTTSGPRGDSGA